MQISNKNKHGSNTFNKDIKDGMLSNSQNITSILDYQKNSKDGSVSDEKGDENSSHSMSEGFRTFIKIKDTKFNNESSPELQFYRQSCDSQIQNDMLQN